MGDTVHRCTLAVVGAGPAGRSLAHRAALAGIDVVLVDRDPDRVWRSTYAAWTDELPGWVDPVAISHQVESVAVYSPTHHTLRRGYTVLDTAALQRSLALDGVRAVAGTAMTTDARSVSLSTGVTVAAQVVVDARGSISTTGPAQTAYGVFVPREQAAPILGADPAVLMDWRPFDGSDDGPRVPSFLYTVPVSADRVLVEETCLVGHPALSVGTLRDRLRTRLSRRGHAIDVDGDDIERVHFAVTGGGGRPWTSRPMTFGAAGGLMHPATGYSVATSMRCADAVVAAIARGDDPGSALWTARARLVHTLRRRGLNALLGLDAETTVEFFDAFFELPADRQRAYLSGRDDPRGVMAAMLTMMRVADPGVGIAVARGAAAPTRW
ncbi:lycopene cyclase family protein [Williamsia sp.]|uniref:lycopene cyclase family protein n=1 Tax=Williamsia sp. TaxID=1872085 RepID=UPI001A21D691|nr:lycopene cyclase family protein [Williamsia sp.]MBJ7288554.1 hypothetical protein [Williamsia sp.]